MFLDRLKTLVPDEWCGRNRRSQQRHHRVTYVECQPLDNDFCVVGPSVWGITRDFSVEGISFTTPYRLNCSYLQVHIPADGYSAVGVLRRQQVNGDRGQPTHYLVYVELLDECQFHY